MKTSNNSSSAARPRLGEILMQRKLLSIEQLDKALIIQKEKDELLGQILIGLKFVEERDVVVALILQCGIPYISITKYNIDPKILKLVPETVAKKFHLIPIDRIDEILSVVMVDPFDEKTRQELERVTKCKIVPFIATLTEIDTAIAKCYKKDTK